MWLQKDERHLLAGYYINVGGIDSERWYSIAELAKLLRRGKYRRRIPEYGEETPAVAANPTFESLKAEITELAQSTRRVELANSLLVNLGFIRMTPHQIDGKVVGVTLTLPGFDLGRRYCSLIQRSNLWFGEYRNHWVWLVLAFFGGVVVTKAADFMVKLLSGR
jgi:hypothetical protein